MSPARRAPDPERRADEPRRARRARRREDRMREWVMCVQAAALGLLLLWIALTVDGRHHDLQRQLDGVAAQVDRQAVVAVETLDLVCAMTPTTGGAQAECDQYRDHVRARLSAHQMAVYENRNPGEIP